MRYLTLCALLVGCAAPTGPWAVDERFSEEEQEQIRQGAATWPVQIDLVFNQRVHAFQTDRRVIVRTDSDVMNVAYKPTSALAVNMDYTRILIIPERAAAHNVPLSWVVAHELGHGFGIPDIDDHSALMYGRTDFDAVRWCITESDARAYTEATGEWMGSTCSE